MQGHAVCNGWPTVSDSETKSVCWRRTHIHTQWRWCTYCLWIQWSQQSVGITTTVQLYEVLNGDTYRQANTSWWVQYIHWRGDQSGRCMWGGGDVPGVDTPLPPMNTPCRSPAIATYGDRLVVAGGRYGGALATVEVLNTTSHQWLSASPLPVKCSEMTSAIVNQELFLLGGTLTSALAVSLPDLTGSSVHSATTKISVQWRTLPAPPLTNSAAISLHGSVVAIGGCHGNKSSTAIHIYQPATNTWSKVGDLPCPRSSCSCTLLPSGEILVAGGLDSNGKQTRRVDAVIFWLCLIPRTVWLTGEWVYTLMTFV